MLKQVAISVLVAGLFSPIAIAQNANQIARVQAGQSCETCNLFQADLSYAEGKKLNLAATRLRQSNFALSTYDDVNLKGADLSVSNLFGARFNRTDFTNVNFKRAIAVGTYFGSSNFAGANLTGANFSGADLTIAKGLTQSQLNQACGDASTRLPKGKTIPTCS